jgi:hypothetical protein
MSIKVIFCFLLSAEPRVHHSQYYWGQPGCYHQHEVCEVFHLSVVAVPFWQNCWWRLTFSIKIKSLILQSCLLTCQYKEWFMEIYDLWATCTICQLFWLATSETQIPMFVITRWHISSVIAPRISIFRALRSMTKAGFLGSSFLLRCPKGRRHRCNAWTVVRSIQSIYLVSKKMVENHSLAESVAQSWMNHWILCNMQYASVDHSKPTAAQLLSCS